MLAIGLGRAVSSAPIITILDRETWKQLTPALRGRKLGVYPSGGGVPVSPRAFVPIVTLAAGLVAWSVRSLRLSRPSRNDSPPPAQLTGRIQGVGGSGGRLP